MFTMRQPDDFHLHLRDGNDVLEHTVGYAATAHFHRILVMPNLKPPIRTTQEAMDYKSRILAHIPPG